MRRSQSWLKDEVKSWQDGGWPDANLPVERIAQIISHVLQQHPQCGSRVYLATNSKDLDEIRYLKSMFDITQLDGSSVSNYVAIAADVFIASKAVAFIGTPGSTVTENIEDLRGRNPLDGQAPNITVFCQYRNVELKRQNVDLDDLKNVVVAISFSGPHFGNIELLKRLYKGFGALVFCASSQSGPLPADVDDVNVGSGWFQYRCLKRAMEKYPNMAGYINSNDDVILQYWNMRKFDFTTIWSEKCKRWANIYERGLVRNDYCNQYEKQNCNSLVDGLGDPLPVGKAALIVAHKSTTKEFREKMALYTGNEDVYCEGDHDFAYIPQRDKDVFLKVAEPYDIANVGFMYLFGSVLRGIVSDDEITKPGGLWMWGYDRDHWRELFESSAGVAAPVIHPIKLSDKDQREITIKRFQLHLDI